MNRLLLIGGVLQAFDQVPEELEPLVDLRRAGLLLGGPGEIELDGGNGVREHDPGSSSLRCVPGRRHPGTYRRKRAVLKHRPPRSKSQSLEKQRPAPSGGREEGSSYTLLNSSRVQEREGPKVIRPTCTQMLEKRLTRL